MTEARALDTMAVAEAAVQVVQEAQAVTEVAEADSMTDHSQVASHTTKAEAVEIEVVITVVVEEETTAAEAAVVETEVAEGGEIEGEEEELSRAPPWHASPPTHTL